MSRRAWHMADRKDLERLAELVDESYEISPSGLVGQCRALIRLHCPQLRTRAEVDADIAKIVRLAHPCGLCLADAERLRLLCEEETAS